MLAILRFLISYEIWIYIVLGVVIFAYLRKLLAAGKQWRGAVFGLEREIAQRRFGAALTLIGIMILMGLGVFIMVSFIAPSYPQVVTLLTPTLDLEAAPTATLAPGASPVAGMGQVASVSTPIPLDSQSGCIKESIEWLYPQNGDELNGMVELKGTVKVTNLGFYKYEFSQAGSNNWVTIAAGGSPKFEEALGGAWNTDQLIPGDYFLRLVVTDSQNQEMPSCQISIRILPK